MEGGDHIVLNNSLTLLQVGNRTNFASAKYLMDNDLLGTEKFGVVKNDIDKNPERSHLDTFFNIVNPTTVVLLDFNDPDVPKDARRTVDLYRRNSDGSYSLDKQDVDFEEFLVEQGYKVIKVSRKDQQELMIGFLHLGHSEGTYVLISCNPHFRQLLDKHEVKNVDIELVEEFKEVGKLEGSLHSALHVIRCLKR